MRLPHPVHPLGMLLPGGRPADACELVRALRLHAREHARHIIQRGGRRRHIHVHRAVVERRGAVRGQRAQHL
ncbi:MAG: hypothetical protein ACK55I_46480, partial [bacterium]